MTTATPTETPVAQDPRPVELGEQLETLLRELVAAHESLLKIAADHRDAIRQADARGMQEAQSRVEAVCRTIAGLDRQRQDLTAAMAPEHPEATLSFLASGLAEPVRGRAVELATTLRELIIRVRTEQRRLRSAADAMLSHVRGIVQQIQQQLNHAGTYGRAGRVDAGATVVSGLDMTS